MTTHLQPCPCCGSAAAFLEAVPDGWIITCTGETPCVATAEIHCTRGEDPRPAMAKQWNTRCPAQAEQQHPDDAAVDRFAAAMKAKLAKSRAKGRGGWNDPNVCSIESLAQLLVEHLDKGNAGTFEDVANFAMMLHQRGADPKVLAEAAAPQPEQSGLVEALKADRDQLLAAAVFFFGMATGGLEQSECGEWDRHEAKIDAALSGSPEGLLRSAQGGAE